MSPLFRTKYDDEALVERAERALSDEPMVRASDLGLLSEKGVIRISGTVSSESQKSHAIDAVRRALHMASLKYDRIEDDILVNG